MARESGISYPTAYRLYSGMTTRLDMDTLDKLCRHFGVGVGEILEYVPDAA